MVEAYRRDASSKDQLISELKATKKRLDAEMKELKRELLQIQVEKQSLESEHSKLQKEVTEVRQQMVEIENHLQSVQKERDEMETRLQVWELLSFGHWGVLHTGYVVTSVSSGYLQVKVLDYLLNAVYVGVHMPSTISNGYLL